MADDDVKKRILARRAKFVAAALAGVSVTTCSKTEPPIVQVPMTTVDGGGNIPIDQTPPPPKYVTPSDVDPYANIDAGTSDPPDNTPPTMIDAGAGSKKKPPKAKPRPCLLMVLNDSDDDPPSRL